MALISLRNVRQDPPHGVGGMGETGEFGERRTCAKEPFGGTEQTSRSVVGLRGDTECTSENIGEPASLRTPQMTSEWESWIWDPPGSFLGTILIRTFRYEDDGCVAHGTSTPLHPLLTLREPVFL